MEIKNPHYEVVAKAIRYIREQQIQQPTLEEISSHVHLSKFHLQRIFKEWAGVSPKKFLQYLTIEKSKALLRAGQSTLETSYQVGLSGSGRLHDLFVRYESCTPGEFKQMGKDLHIHWAIVSSYFGPVIIAETDLGICHVAFLDEEASAEAELQERYPSARLHQGLGANAQALAQYFSTWEIPQQPIQLFLQGTPFQLQVWKALLQIPTAQLRTYQDIGQDIGKPKAVRAIGTAIGKNPIAYLIPCHRVIRGDGQMGNYRWQPERKMAINGFERARFLATEA
ncbi:MAG: methylated-DNA--[protein]-cysteine S-methyltransferase [Bacteroidota bacterium]